jgi:hypothetical protein
MGELDLGDVPPKKPSDIEDKDKDKEWVSPLIEPSWLE